jgi:hypothetical protein
VPDPPCRSARPRAARFFRVRLASSRSEQTGRLQPSRAGKKADRAGGR